jgi:hypothetical protein
VIVIGGFYFGSLASWFRLKYPSLCFLAWSSSSPVETKADYSAYDSQIHQIISHLNPVCAQQLTAEYPFLQNDLMDNSRYQDLGLPPTTNPYSAMIVVSDAIALAAEANKFQSIANGSCPKLALDDFHGFAGVMTNL